ncbi:hypothetical protein BV25DRAFT_1823493 [Artomyces pyxidatus]|uniref:Uncharacterized protein n=1 Tax=Artomyces pyxidatus TaxID=48021 RepID=A0ACB8T797_9AGAM|nr:hypothetical protein BV25DRAFT_1823493 [Artomyces pyxidatus]
MSAPRSFASRPSDLIYFLFFLMHIPATLLVDCQALYPASYVPDIVKAIPAWYVGMSGDPLIGGVMDYLGDGPNLVWFKTFLYLEAIFQLPVFVLGARGLWKDNQGIYTLLAIYGASTSTTTLACLGILANTPTTSPETIAAEVVSITLEQRLMLFSSYIPFFLVPLYMAVDMAWRVQKLVTLGVRHAETIKQQ